MRHLDLFTGIGGFALAAQNVWEKDYEPVAFCEIDKFCQKVLGKHWPNVEIINDVKDDRIKQFRDIDLLTAGVPCQPASVAGKKRGTSDERWLWPETLDVIRAVRPRWALLENVSGLFSLEDGKAFNGILSELVEIGYDCWWEVIPACAIGAPHRRDRIWIIAYARSKEPNGLSSKWKQEILSVGGSGQDVADSQNANGGRADRTQNKRRGNQKIRRCSIKSRRFQYWSVEPNVGRVANGIPNRVDRLKALGNAIVPQVAMAIMEGIRQQEGLYEKTITLHSSFHNVYGGR